MHHNVPVLDETKSATPDFSPGPVSDDEALIRAIFKPDHVVRDEVQPAAIPIQDLKNRGFSVHRIAHVTPTFVSNEINRMLARRHGGEQRESQGVARFTARTVRTIRDKGTQVFVVIDTAYSHNPGHASIYLSDLQLKESQARRMRNKLLPLLNERITVREAFRPA